MWATARAQRHLGRIHFPPRRMAASTITVHDSDTQAGRRPGGPGNRATGISSALPGRIARRVQRLLDRRSVAAVRNLYHLERRQRAGSQWIKQILLTGCIRSNSPHDDLGL